MPDHSNPYGKDSSALAAQPRLRPLPVLGDVIGEKYRIETIIGQGGMGAVYRARHLLTERAVAVKWMLPEVGGEEAVQRFLREARAMGRIDHAGVVGVLDVGVDEGATFLVMELLKGSSLREILEEQTTLEPREAIGLLMPALEGVEAAHRNHVVHRDLKPENIFVVRSGDGTVETTKVLDFGISKLRDDRLDHSPQVDMKKGGVVTKTGVTIGTPSYMSPEQIRGSRDIDARTDIWSLGVILYELLTGEVPFRAESFGSLLVSIATESYPPLDAVRPELPPMLVAAVHRALEKEPSVRFPDVASFAAALESFGPPGCRFRAPDVSRPTDVTGEPANGSPRVPSRQLAETAVARARDEGAKTAAARPPRAPADVVSDGDISSRGLDLPSPRALGPSGALGPRVSGHARTAVAGGASEPAGDTPRIPSLPPLALEDVPIRVQRPAAKRPEPSARPERVVSPDPAEDSADPRRLLKLGALLLAGVIAVAVVVRLALGGAAGSTTPMAPPSTVAAPLGVPVRSTPPTTRVAPPAARPMPAWPPPTEPRSAASSTVSPDGTRALSQPPAAAVEPVEPGRADRHAIRRPTAPLSPPSPAQTAGTAPVATPPVVEATPTVTTMAGTMAAPPTGRTGGLSRDEF